MAFPMQKGWSSAEPSPSQIKLLERLESLGIETTTVWHEPVLTVEAAQRVEQKAKEEGTFWPEGAGVKNLFVSDKKKRFILVSALDDTPIQLKSLGRAVGTKGLRFAKENDLETILGVVRGAVTPLSVINDERKGLLWMWVVDHALVDQGGFIHVHPLDNAGTTTIPVEGLLKFVKSCGVEILELDFVAMEQGTFEYPAEGKAAPQRKKKTSSKKPKGQGFTLSTGVLCQDTSRVLLCMSAGGFEWGFPKGRVVERDASPALVAKAKQVYDYALDGRIELSHHQAFHLPHKDCPHREWIWSHAKREFYEETWFNQAVALAPSDALMTQYEHRGVTKVVVLWKAHPLSTEPEDPVPLDLPPPCSMEVALRLVRWRRWKKKEKKKWKGVEDVQAFAQRVGEEDEIAEQAIAHLKAWVAQWGKAPSACWCETLGWCWATVEEAKKLIPHPSTQALLNGLDE